jgi:dipeptidyl aminopeptidase/acylaminoacyl peptidase
MRDYDSYEDSREERPSSNKSLWIVLGIVGGIVLVMLLVCGGLAVVVIRGMTQFAQNFQQQMAELAAEDLDLQQEDYAQARSQFRTKLLRQGPAPQEWQPVQTPAGVQEVEFPSGKLRLKAWINPPKGAGKRPAVLFLHGGWAFGDDDWDMAQPFRDAGYVVMTPILRGENGQPGSFTMFYDEVDDVVAAAQYLAKRPYVDEKRIYLSGHSAGGTLTLLAAMASPRFKAAASFSGSPNQKSFARESQQAVPFDQSNMREFAMRSPIAYATSFKCPVRLYYGSEEPMFALSSATTAMRAKTKGLDVEAVSIPGDHDTAVPEAMRQAIQFFKSH